MAASGGIHLSVDQTQMQQVYAALKTEADGKKLRTQLTKELKAVIKPAQEKAQRNIQAMPSQDAKYGDMRESISAAIKISVRTTGRNTGVMVVANKGKYPRKFNNAAAQFNRAGWRHPVFGNTQVWVTQVGKPGYFDSIMGDKPEYLEAVRSCLQAMADSIAARSQE